MVYSLIGCFIPIKNKKEIINYVFVDEDKFEHLNTKKWYINRRYVKCNSYGVMHRYLMSPSKQNIVDHINNNALDNRISNLRITTQKENIMNINKTLKKCSSKYKGVHFHKLLKKFRAKCGKIIIGNYEKEIHAAWAYDEYCRKHFNYAKLNNIQKPNDFIEFNKFPKKTNDKNIYYTKSKKWRVQIKKISHGIFNTKEEAINYRDKILKISSKIDIIRNDNGIAIRKILNKENKEYDILVDDDIYIKLHKYSLHLNKDGYVLLSNKQLLSRFIMDAKPGEIIDHINSNKLDNRICNLRIVTNKENAYNKKKQNNTSSKYIGVYYNKSRKKWIANIKINGKSYYIGQFDDEDAAAKARDIETKKNFGIYGKLNFNSN